MENPFWFGKLLVRMGELIEYQQRGMNLTNLQINDEGEETLAVWVPANVCVRVSKRESGNERVAEGENGLRIENNFQLIKCPEWVK